MSEAQPPHDPPPHETLPFERALEGVCPLEGTPYRERLLAQIDRCRRIHRYKLAAGSSDPPPPALCVVAGGTNVGKTSLANAVASRPLGSPSALARATRHVTILCHRDRAAAFLDPRFLPGYERVLAERPAPPGEPASEGGVVVLTHDDERFAALALADTPDIDSVLQANHRVAEDLRIAADAVLFVTSEEKYNDEVCVRTLEQAARWGKRVLLVLNKHSEPEPLEDLERRVLPRLSSEAPADAPPPELFTVPALPNAAARPDALAQAAAAVRTALERLAQEADRLRAAAQAGARRALALELEELLSALEQEQAAVASYRSELRAIATRAADRWRERSASRPVQQQRHVYEQLVRALHVPVLDDVYRRGAAVFAAIGGFVRERLFGEPSAESRQRELEAEREREEREISETELRRALAEARSLPERFGADLAPALEAALLPASEAEALGAPGEAFFTALREHAERWCDDVVRALHADLCNSPARLHAMRAIKAGLRIVAVTSEIALTGSIGWTDPVLAAFLDYLAKTGVERHFGKQWLEQHLRAFHEQRTRLFEQLVHERLEALALARLRAPEPAAIAALREAARSVSQPEAEP